MTITTASADNSACGSKVASEEGPAFDPENVCADYPVQSGPISDLAAQDPDQQAWVLFTVLNRTEDSKTPYWRTWPEQADVYPANPDPDNPPKWEEIGGGDEHFRGRPSTQLSMITGQTTAKDTDSACALFANKNAEEVRINQTAVKYLY